MNSPSIKILLFISCALFFAIYLGVAAATAQFEAIAWIAGILALAILLLLGGKVWALIPTFGVLQGFINGIPAAPSPWYLAIAAAGCMLAARFALRTRDFQWRFSWADFLILLQVAILAQAYVRNPTGFLIFGGDVVGGKPYVEYAIGIVGYFCLAFIRTDYETVKKVIIAVILFMLGDALLLAFTSFFPQLALVIGRFYSNVDYTAAAAELMGQGDAVFDIDRRYGSLRSLGLVLGLLAVAFYRPITCLIPLYLGRFLTFTTAIVLLLFSGFRSELIRIGSYFIAATLIRRKYVDLFLGGLVGVVAIALLAVTGLSKELPFAAQRVLSFLPIEISDQARHEAEGSANWRIEMWKLALTTDRYIQNKILGDGFGFSAAEQQANDEIQMRQGYISSEDAMDFYIAKGSYHGFHVETIRFTGAVGLVIATIILFYFMFLSIKLIGYFKDRPGAGYINFLCIPFTVNALYYWFIFGSYKREFVLYLLGAGFLKLIDNVRVKELAEARASAPVRSLEPQTTAPTQGLPAYSRT